MSNNAIVKAATGIAAGGGVAIMKSAGGVAIFAGGPPAWIVAGGVAAGIVVAAWVATRK